MSKKPKVGASLFADYDEGDAASIRALANGTADTNQQKIAYKWIIEWASDAYGMSYRKGDPGETAFLEGRRFVGNQIIKLTKLKENTNARSSSRTK